MMDSPGGGPDDVILLCSIDIGRPSSGRRGTPSQNLIPARILSVAVHAGATRTSLVGGGALPTLPGNDNQRGHPHFDGFCVIFVCVFAR